AELDDEGNPPTQRISEHPFWREAINLVANDGARWRRFLLMPNGRRELSLHYLPHELGLDPAVIEAIGHPPRPLLGKCARQIEAIARRTGLNASDQMRLKLQTISELLNGYCIDFVHEYDLRYEPRASTSCPQCGVVYVGSKTGEIARLALADIDGEPLISSVRFDSTVRALCHLHGSTAFNLQSTLLVGTDDGRLHVVVEEGGRLERCGDPFHLDAWWRRTSTRLE